MLDRSLIHMFIAGLFFFCMNICVKFLPDLPTLQIVFVRALVALVICLIQLKALGVSLKGNSPKLLFARGFFGTLGLVSYFYLLQRMPLSTVLVLKYLSPIFVTILGALFLKQYFKMSDVAFLGVSFLGVVLVKGFSTDVSLWLMLCGIFCAAASSLAYFFIAKMKETEHPVVIILYFPLVTLPLIAPFAFSQWVWPSSIQWFLLLGVGISVQCAQYFMTLAFQRGNASNVSLISYFGIIYALLADVLYFGERFSKGALLGMSLILIGVVGMSIVKKIRSRKAKLAV